MHHKRRRPRIRHAGCKTWKVNGVRTEARGGEKLADERRRHSA